MGKVSSYPTVTTPATSDYLLGDVTAGGPTTSRFSIASLINTIFANPSATFSQGWTGLGYSLTYGANNGNKEFTATTAADLRSIVSLGTKLRIPRSTTPPSQSMSFLTASSQYAAKASPTGLTSSTSTLTVETWVNVTSLTNGACIGSVFDGTNGWLMYQTNTGQLTIQYYSGGAVTTIQTYQSLPLTQWMHVAGVISSVSGKTGVIYVNGNLVPTYLSSSSASSLTPAGSLVVGANRTGSSTFGNYFNGYISEFRVWSSARTQAQIQANMAINCVGTETGLICLIQGGGNFADATTNANTLTASGGASATQASNPYNATEYGIVTNISYSAPTTTLTIFTGNTCTVPNATLGTISYSGLRAPFGFPTGREKWRVYYINNQQYTGTASSISAWYNFGSVQMAIPSGEWALSYRATVGYSLGTAGRVDNVVALSSSLTGASDLLLQTATGSGNLVFMSATLAADSSCSQTAMTTWYLIQQACTTSGGGLFMFGASSTPAGITVVIAECAYV